MAVKQWEYCLVTCTPMSGLDEEGIRLSYQLVTPEQVQHLETYHDETLPLAAIGQLFNELGAEGWELIAYDTSTHRGVFKRPKP